MLAFAMDNQGRVSRAKKPRCYPDSRKFVSKVASVTMMHSVLVRSREMENVLSTLWLSAYLLGC